jgi:hypothetical protein
MENYSKKEIDVHGVYYYNSMGDYHRTDGPAVEYVFGLKFWYIIGKCHRLNGPANVWADGDKEWCLNDQTYSKSCHNRLVLFYVLEPRKIILGTKENS